MKGLAPVVHDNAAAGLAYEILKQHVDAVCLVVVHVLWRVVAKHGLVVVVVVHLLPHLVEAVDEVEDLNLRKVSVWSEAPALGHLGNHVEIMSQGACLVGRHRCHFQAFK